MQGLFACIVDDSDHKADVQTNLGLQWSHNSKSPFLFENTQPSLFLISSPEHEVLMVSYCGQSMSVVRRASCVVRRQQLL